MRPPLLRRIFFGAYKLRYFVQLPDFFVVWLSALLGSEAVKPVVRKLSEEEA
jgi:hypothetical protein